jgi:hypothetical protein
LLSFDFVLLCCADDADDYDYDDDDGSAAHVGKANLTDTLEGDIHGLFSSKEGAWLITGTPACLPWPITWLSWCDPS